MSTMIKYLLWIRHVDRDCIICVALTFVTSGFVNFASLGQK